MIQYRLPPEAVRRGALSAAAVRAVTSLLPIVLAVVLLRRLGWAPTGAFWGVVAALVGLVVVRLVDSSRAHPLADGACPHQPPPRRSAHRCSLRR